MRKGLLVILSIFGIVAMQAYGEYSIPAGRTPPSGWYPAGLDVIGGFPTAYLHTNIVTGFGSNAIANAVLIQNAINAAGTSTLVLITNTGVVWIDASGITDPWNDSGHLYFAYKTNVTLRGASPCNAPWWPTNNTACTELLMTNGSGIYFIGGRKDSSWYPGIQLGIGITSGYTQGSTALTVSNTSGFAAGQLICAYQNKDSSAVDDRGYTWLGEDSGPDPHVWAQYTIVTSVSGNTLYIDPPIYQVTPSPQSPMVRRQTSCVVNCGLENLKVIGDTTQQYLIYMGFSKFCWVSGCETYGGGKVSSGSPHIWCEFSYACEFFRNYLHYGPEHDSGENYGIEFYHWNSRHLVLNNAIQEVRHSIIFEGGGNGCVIAYNFSDNNWESVQGQETTIDNSIQSESLTMNHGAHPFMNLWEGNSTECMEGDYTQGSSSYITLFRNSIRGYRSQHPLSSPWFWNLVEIQNYNRYYNLVGNVIGSPGISSRPGWNGGTVFNNNSGGNLPNIFRFGLTSDGGSYNDTQSYSTALIQGNYDFVANKIDYLADTANTNYASSLYYTNTPSWWPSGYTWPPYSSAVVTSAALDGTNLPIGMMVATGDYPAGNNAEPPPTISLSSPTNGADYMNTSTNSISINLAATVGSNGHTITMVQFYKGASLLGNVTSPPYNLTWNSVRGGTYSLTARLIYDTNLTMNSAPVTITVSPLPPTNLTIVPSP